MMRSLHRLVPAQRTEHTTNGDPDRAAEEGMAFLIVVVVISLVMAVLAATLFRVALDNVSTSSRMVQQNQALQAAEAGIDLAYRKIQSATSLAAMPCTTGTHAIAGTLGGAPARSTFTVTLTYYSTLTPLTSLSCTGASPTNASLKGATAVRLTSLGRDVAQTAKVQSEANISTPDKTGVFHESVFVNGSLSLQGGGSFVGGNNNVYLNGTLTCRGSSSVDGSVVVFGNVNTSGGCSIAGEVEATKAITLSGSAVVGGTLTSTCAPATPTCAVGISVSGTKVSVSGSMYAKSAIHIGSSSWKTRYLAPHTVTVGGTQVQVQYTINSNMTSLATPTRETFPPLNWSATGWKTDGYTVETASTCAALKAMLSTIGSATSSVAIYTACAVTIPTISLAHSLAIFSTASISIKQSDTISSKTSHHTLFLVVPTTSDKTCGSNVTVTIGGQILTTVTTFVYAPCHVKIAGTGTIKSGKIYSGQQLTVDGSINMGSATFTPPGAGAVRASPVIGLIYERELS